MIATDAPLLIFDEIDSTNEEAQRRAARGDAGPIWLMARRQNAGRGRRGRTWTSGEGNLFLTYLGATAKPIAEVALLGFAAGIALAEVCDALAGQARVQLKWPNDLMIDGKKAAGLLLESGALADGRSWFAIGLGLNLRTAPATDQPTIALADILPGQAPAPELVARDLAARVARWAHILDEQGFAPLQAAWMSRAYGLERPVTVALGAQSLTGLMRGLSPKGELLLALPNGEMRPVAAGDIHFPATEAV